jgi:hypothetical protein
VQGVKLIYSIILKIKFLSHRENSSFPYFVKPVVAVRERVVVP